jgi:hypothetical protein
MAVCFLGHELEAMCMRCRRGEGSYAYHFKSGRDPIPRHKRILHLLLKSGKDLMPRRRILLTLK